jgi:hypothetical protein
MDLKILYSNVSYVDWVSLADATAGPVFAPVITTLGIVVNPVPGLATVILATEPFAFNVVEKA